MFFDTHCHLEDPQLAADRPTVLQQAQSVGVERILAVALDSASSQILCTQKYSNGDPVRIYPTAGIHPNHAAKEPEGAWALVENLARGGKAVALGETGLDRHWHDTPFAQQQAFFIRHLTLARELDLPVVIHCREATEDMIVLLRRFWEETGPVRGVMHSFSGEESFAQTCLELGLLIGLSGVLTFKNAQPLRDLAKHLPRDRVVLETDAPYLAPVPKRGKRNEPAFVSFTGMTLAELWGQSIEETARQTTQNACKLFCPKEMG